jgi:hypothetical protein
MTLCSLIYNKGGRIVDRKTEDTTDTAEGALYDSVVVNELHVGLSRNN